jgi:hypothetical protein
MKRSILFLLFLFMAAAPMAAHFVFVVPQSSGASVSVFISETLDPDPAVDIDLVRDTKLSLRDMSGRESPVSLVRAGNVYGAQLSSTAPGVLHGLTDIGISGPADKSYLLLYHPKTILGDAFDPRATVGGSTPVELVPQGRAGALTLRLLGRGKPLGGAEITVLLPDGTEKVVKTDPSGQTEVFTQTGRYGAWARFWETTAAGEREGRKFGETHHYATLVFSAGSAGAPAKSAASLTLPQATASFGAAVAEGWLYVYGGHVSPTHNYFIEAVSGRFDRLRLTGDAVWESLPSGPAVQGMNLAAHKGKVYRVGGMAPRNRRGETADNRSVPDVARFDPGAGKWESITPLPEPRSSHDVAVLGDQLYVVGGWNMMGKGQTWADTFLAMDLSQGAPSWTRAPQPFKRRALMAAGFENKLYVIGGMDERGTVLRTVSIYDPQTKKWNEGPPLPEGVLGFAPAAGVHQGRLFVSVSDGSLFRLNPARNAWEKTGSTTPRVAHRIASREDAILVLGGAADGNNLDLVEAVAIRP